MWLCGYLSEPIFGQSGECALVCAICEPHFTRNGSTGFVLPDACYTARVQSGHDCDCSVSRRFTAKRDIFGSFQACKLCSVPADFLKEIKLDRSSQRNPASQLSSLWAAPDRCEDFSRPLLRPRDDLQEASGVSAP